MINSLFRRFFKFSISIVSSFFSGVPRFSVLSHHGDPSKSLQGFTLCFQLLFLLVILSLPEFFMKVLHDGFIKDLIPSRSVHRHSLLRSSSILHLAFWSAILSTLSFEVVSCHSWQFEFVSDDSYVVKNEVVKPIIFSLLKEIFSTNQSFCRSYLGLVFT